MADVLLDLQAEIADHLGKICKLFKQRPKITIVIRTPWLSPEKEGDVILSDDDFDLAIEAINHLRNRAPVGEERPNG